MTLEQKEHLRICVFAYPMPQHAQQALTDAIAEIDRLEGERDFYQRAFKLLSKTRKKDCPYCVWHKDLGKSDGQEELGESE
jgi:hypothetical protein